MSITASCGNVQSWSAIVIGFVGGIVYMNANNIMVYFHIDDPVQAFPVHGACGMWGLIGTALFDWGGPQGKSAGAEAADKAWMHESVDFYSYCVIQAF